MSRLQRSSRRAQPLASSEPTHAQRMNNAAALLLGVSAVMVLIAAAMWAARLPSFKLHAIRVEGEVARNSAATLRANVMPHLNGNFFTVDMAHTRAAFEAVPWVRKASVQREFPSSLKVVLQEHKPAARWGAPGDAFLVNTFGEVFEVSQGDADAQSLPLLTGPAGQAALLLQAWQRLAPLYEQIDTVLDALELTNQGSWRAQLDSGAVVNMGHGSLDDIQARTHRFIATFTQVSSRYSRALESADLRYATGYAIKLQGITTVTAAELKNKKVKR